MIHTEPYLPQARRLPCSWPLGSVSGPLGCPTSGSEGLGWETTFLPCPGQGVWPLPCIAEGQSGSFLGLCLHPQTTKGLDWWLIRPFLCPLGSPKFYLLALENI